MGGRRGPAQLRFRALLDAIRVVTAEVVETRQRGKVAYTLPDCLVSTSAMLFLQDPPLLEFQRCFQDQIQQNNLATVFGVDEIPSDSQLQKVIPFAPKMHSHSR